MPFVRVLVEFTAAMLALHTCVSLLFKLLEGSHFGSWVSGGLGSRSLGSRWTSHLTAGASGSTATLLTGISRQSRKTWFWLLTESSSATATGSLIHSSILQGHSELHGLEFPLTHTRDLPFSRGATVSRLLSFLNLILSYVLFLLYFNNSMSLCIEYFSLLSKHLFANFDVLWVGHIIEGAATLATLL